jgi:hypothetical protein
MTDLEAQLARKRRNAKAERARRKRGQYRRMITIPGTQLRRLAELGYLERVDNSAAQITALEAFLYDESTAASSLGRETTQSRRRRPTRSRRKS